VDYKLFAVRVFVTDWARAMGFYAETLRMRVPAAIAVTVVLGPLLILVVAAAGQERIVNRKDADRIFGLNRAQWEAEARRMVDSQDWKVGPGSGDTGTGVMTVDPKSGVGLAVQPSFRDAQGPPEMLVIGSYYPAGTFRRFSEQTKREMEAAASSDLGPPYSISVAFSSIPSPPPGFDVVEVIITRARR